MPSLQLLLLVLCVASSFIELTAAVDNHSDELSHIINKARAFKLKQQQQYQRHFATKNVHKRSVAQQEQAEDVIPIKPLTRSKGRPLRIISIDGGGVRGVIPAAILVRLEEKIKNITKDSSASLTDFVDVFAGASTGGLMTLAYLAKYNATAVLDVWAAGGPFIFSKKMKNSLGPELAAKYKATNLETMLKAAFKEMELSQFNNRSYAIVSFDSATYQSGTFTRKSNENRGGFKAWQAGRATSAAPTYFPTAYLTSSNGQNYTFIDGGIMANNPALIALNTASEDFEDFSLKDTVLLSLGTGLADNGISGFKNWGYARWFKEGDIIDLFLNGPMVGATTAVAEIFNTIDKADNFARVQYDKTFADPVIDSCQSANFDMDNTNPDNISLLVKCGFDIADRYDLILDLFAHYFATTWPEN